ncbi:MAG: hypothetical protein WA687_12915 [Solirubrobacterales bacterium]
MPKEVSDAFAALREESRAATERRLELAKAARPTKKERRAMGELFAGEGQKAGMREIGSKYADRVQETDIEVPESVFALPQMDSQPAVRADTSFWWAETNASVPSFYRADFLDDGLHFNGKFTYDANPLFGFSFGATASFGIDFERLPPSPAGRWRSSPHVELFGGLRGWTGPYDLFDGDSWCKVWMVLRQTVFQWAFGPTGPVLVKRGEAFKSKQLINEENGHHDVFIPLTGFEWMPWVWFGDIFPQTVWSHLEVRFDVQLEGNSFLWLDPNVLLRHSQWPVFAA